MLAASGLLAVWLSGRGEGSAPTRTVLLASPDRGQTRLLVDPSDGPARTVEIDPPTGRAKDAGAPPSAQGPAESADATPKNQGATDGRAADRGAAAGGPRGSGRSRAVPSLAVRPALTPRFALVRLAGRSGAPLYRRPGGERVGRLGPRTEFGSPVVLGVAARRGGWIGFPTPKLPNGALGWTRLGPGMELYWTRYSLRVDLSSRSLTLRYGDRRVARWPVTVGAAGSETPLGRYSVTDALTFDSSPYYGCCALALSGHQPKLPIGWLGGSRVAIHGTIGPVGAALSHGCIRATNAAMRVLFRRIPLGTPVFVSA